MVFTLGTLFEAGLLLINAVAILNEEKFLKKGEENADNILRSYWFPAAQLAGVVI